MVKKLSIKLNQCIKRLYHFRFVRVDKLNFAKQVLIQLQNKRVQLHFAIALSGVHNIVQIFARIRINNISRHTKMTTWFWQVVKRHLLTGFRENRKFDAERRRCSQDKLILCYNDSFHPFSPGRINFIFGKR